MTPLRSLAALTLSTLCLGTVGCSREAVVRTRSGHEIHARIDGTEAGRMRLTRDGEALGLDVAEVTEIEHPGTPAMTTGVVLVLLGTSLIVADSSREGSSCNADGVCMGGAATAAGAVAAGSGIAIGGYGILVNQLSIAHAAPGERPSVARGLRLGVQLP